MSSSNEPADYKPPSYAKFEGNVDLMTPEDRLRSLQAFAEGKKYIGPGEAGSLMSGNDPRSLAFSGRAPESQYAGSLPPPGYGVDNSEAKPRLQSLIDKIFKRRSEKQPEKSSDISEPSK